MKLQTSFLVVALLFLGAKCHAQNLVGDSVKGEHAINMKLIKSAGSSINQYIKSAYNGNDAYYPQLGNSGQRIKVSLGGSRGDLKHGSKIRLYYEGSDRNSWSSSWKPYNALYTSQGFTSAAWYTYTAKHAEWKVWHVDQTKAARNESIKYGDSVWIESDKYPNHYLGKEGDYLDALSESETRKRGEWQFFGHGASHLPPELAKSNENSVTQMGYGAMYLDQRHATQSYEAAEESITVETGVDVGFSQSTSSQWDVGVEVGFQAGTEANFVHGSASFGYGEAEGSAKETVQSKRLSKTITIKYHKSAGAETLVFYEYKIPWKLWDVDCGGVKSAMRVLDESVQLVSSKDIEIPKRVNGKVEPIAWTTIKPVLDVYRKNSPSKATWIEQNRKPEWIKNGWVYEGKSPPVNVVVDNGTTDNPIENQKQEKDAKEKAQEVFGDAKEKYKSLMGKIPSDKQVYVWVGVGLLGLVGFFGMRKSESFKGKLTGFLALVATLLFLAVAFVPMGIFGN